MLMKVLIKIEVWEDRTCVCVCVCVWGGGCRLLFQFSTIG